LLLFFIPIYYLLPKITKKHFKFSRMGFWQFFCAPAQGKDHKKPEDRKNHGDPAAQKPALHHEQIIERGPGQERTELTVCR